MSQSTVITGGTPVIGPVSGGSGGGVTSAQVSSAISSQTPSVIASNTPTLPIQVGSISRTLLSKLKDFINIKDYGAVCDGVTDDSAAINAALLAAGAMLGIPVGANADNPGNPLTPGDVPANLPQGTVRFPHGSQVAIASVLSVPPGVTLDLNGSTLFQTSASSDAVQCYYQNGTANWYANSKNCVKNGIIQGPGAGTSTGRALFLSVCIGSVFSDLILTGFKYGLVMRECEYNVFTGVFALGNRVGSYQTRRPDFTAPSIDNYFAQCRFAHNTDYGLWLQQSNCNQWYKTELNYNGKCDLVIGPQIPAYISGATVLTPGAGYTPGQSYPLTITDATGSQASGYAVANSSGQISTVTITDGVGTGVAFTSPSATIAGGTTAATFSLQTVDDSSDLGDISGGGSSVNSFFGLKMEGSGSGAGRPNCGFAIYIGAGSQTKFYDLQISAVAGRGGANWYRWIFNGSQSNSNHVVLPQFVFAVDDVPNPALATDYGLVRNMGTIYMQYAQGTTAAHIYQYVINSTGQPDLANSLVLGAGNSTSYLQTLQLAGGYFLQAALQIQQVGDLNQRFMSNFNGDLWWGPGSFSFTGTTAAGSITVSGVVQIYNVAVGQPVSGPGIPAGATIATINTGGGSFTLSAAATAAGTVTLVGGPDTNLFRSGANMLATKGSIAAASMSTTPFTPIAYYDGGGPSANLQTWSDDKYMYRRNSTGHIVFVPWQHMPGDTAAAAGTTM